MSSAYDVSGCCTTDTVYPSFLRMSATASQPEPSANAPCTKTTFLIPFFEADCAEADSSVPPASVAASMATTKRFFMASLQLAASMNRPEFDGRGVGQLTFLGSRVCAHISFEGRAKLYEFACLVFFTRKIGVTEMPLFAPIFRALTVVPCFPSRRA